MTDSKALIERLREQYGNLRPGVSQYPLEAADLIETQAREIGRLRAALEGVLTGSTDIECGERVIYAGAVNAVRAALQETSHDA